MTRCGRWAFSRREGRFLRSAIPLYDAMAGEYENGFYDPPHRKAYDLLAWEYVSSLIPQHPAVIVDAGCGAGRWVDRVLPLGHHVIGIESAPEMVKVLERKKYGPEFTLMAEDRKSVV